MHAETERVYHALHAPRFSADDEDELADAVLRRQKAYEQELQSLLAMFVCAGYWATVDYQRLLAKFLARIADIGMDSNGYVHWLNLRRYPGCLLLYGLGLAAAARGTYDILRGVLSLSVRSAAHKEMEAITLLLSPESITERLDKIYFVGREREYTPLNNHLFEVLRDPLHEFLPGDRNYEDAFDSFEYLLGLAHCYRTATENELDAIRNGDKRICISGPLGRFVWRCNQRDLPYQHDGLDTALGRSGVFPDAQRFELVKLGFDRFCVQAKYQRNWW